MLKITLAQTLTREDRKIVNVALHALGCPTLGKSRSLAEWLTQDGSSRDPKRMRGALRTVGVALVAERPASTGHVAAKIREASARKAALAMLAEFAA